MKVSLFMLLVALSAVFGAEEKKTEKRGAYGLGYGLAPAPLLGHSYSSGLYGGHGYSGLGYNSGLYGGRSLGYSSGLYGGHGYNGLGYSSGLYGGHGYGGLGGLGGGYYGGYGGLGHGIGAPLLGNRLYGGHGYSAPLQLSHSVAYSAPLVNHAPLVGLGHGWH